MKKFAILAGGALAVSVAAYTLSGCGGGAVAEMAEEDLAEAVAQQAISAYYSVGLEFTTEEGQTVGVACDRGGELNWSALDDTGEVYTISSRGCTVEGPNGEISIEGEYTVSGFPPTVDSTGSITDLDGKTISVDGSVTATGANGNSLNCDYAFDIGVMGVTEDGSSVTVAVDISGQVCNSRNFGLETEFTVSGQVDSSDPEIEG